MKKCYTAHRFENHYGWLEIREQPDGQFYAHWEAWDNHKKGGTEELTLDVSDQEGHVYIDALARIADRAQMEADDLNMTILLETAKRNFIAMAHDAMNDPTWQEFVGTLRALTEKGHQNP
jgi:hypothetical protein